MTILVPIFSLLPRWLVQKIYQCKHYILHQGHEKRLRQTEEEPQWSTHPFALANISLLSDAPDCTGFYGPLKQELVEKPAPCINIWRIRQKTAKFLASTTPAVIHLAFMPPTAQSLQLSSSACTDSCIRKKYHESVAGSFSALLGQSQIQFHCSCGPPMDGRDEVTASITLY